MNTLYEKCAATFTPEQLELLSKAIDFAQKAHSEQKRESGENYFVHPEVVATMLYDMGMDSQTVIAGLLHDVVEDSEGITLEQISAIFGAEIARMVDGVTKLTKSGEKAYITREEQQAENLRKMFLAIANDVRVVIIKLADRLHNMRTLEYCAGEKRARKAKETLDVYAPLAHRFGMGAIKAELEDLAFFHLMPEEYERLSKAIALQQQERMRLLENAISTIKGQLITAGIKAEINGRPKHLYSTYRKIVKQNSSIDEIYDLIAVRVIVETVNDCYAALGVIHSLWKPVPGRFKDYIAMPKPNMYRSLHTTLFSDIGIPFEVQIRTYEMHKTAEYGIAAHWMYKEGRANMDELDSKLAWLRQALEYENDADNAKEFMDNVRKDFFSEYVFVLTPRGDVIDLPAGSTPLDFAYRIHTNVGHRTQHAKVNGSMVRLDYKLKTNDVVEIVTSASQPGPSRDWIKIVKTQQAKAKIRQWFKKANREENIKNGRDMLEEAARRHGYHLSDLTKPEYYNELLKRHNMGNLEDLYATIGYGGISTGQTLHRLMELHRKATKAAEITEALAERDEQKPIVHGTGRGVVVSGDPNMVVRFAHCCSPLPGDRIIGYITRGRGVSIHREDCPNIKELLIDPERIIGVEWATDIKSSYTANIHLTATERSGILMDISQLLVNMNITLIAVNAKTDKNNQVTVQLSFEVKDTAQMNSVIKNLRKIKSVNEVYRLSV
ncbi:MAG: GTP pyrophosphokinase [Firmicutes bacterium ADurb.Bin182]|nr:MAG: GTP pyrophosphokinase [Firmicutes bacterium ADurb.Bin182]